MQTTFKDLHRPKTFAVDRLPWIIMGAALLFFLATLNHWLTFGSVIFVGQVGDWFWPRNMMAPLAYVFTLPFRLLPVTALPVALNAAMAVLAAFTLGQLARCVALFPQDRTQQQRDRETSEYSLLSFRWAWVPPVFAVLLAAFHSTFWEHSVVATGEMIELALFAYCVRSLLEFRLEGVESWAWRAALGFGLLMANDWLMVGMLPLLLGALVWMRGVAFFNLRFLLRMAGLGLLGFSLIMLMPWLQSRQADGAGDFWPLLKSVFVSDKTYLMAVLNRQYWVLGITSLLPLAIISIRWPSSFGDNSPMGAAIASLIFHLAHCFLLLLGLWVLFDSPFSPRQVSAWSSWLPLYFLAFLCLGYFCAYFLLIFGKAARTRGHTAAPANPLNPFIIGALCIVIVTAPALLFYKNFPSIRAMNGPTLRNFSQQILQQLPARPALVLNDEPTTYIITVAALRLNPQAPRHALLLSRSMYAPAYQRFLKETSVPEFAAALPPPTTNLVVGSSQELVEIINKAAKTMPVYYLHYSFGYYFENYRLAPAGIAYQLQAYPPGQLDTPALDEATIARNEQFWTAMEMETIPALSRNNSLLNVPKSTNPFVRHLNLAPLPDGQAFAIATIYSRALDFWGVQLQRSGRLALARHRFEQSLALNPGNVSASINLLFNQNLLTNSTEPAILTRELEDQLHAYNAWDRFLLANGPVDEPQFLFQQGLIFAQGGLYRQAADFLYRVTQLSPGNFTAYLTLANIQKSANYPDDALRTLRLARKLPGAGASQNELLNAETTAYYAKQQPAKAAILIEAALSLQPRDLGLLKNSLQIYLAHQQNTNALSVVNRMLRLMPDDIDTLVNLSYIQLQLGQFKDAVVTLNRVLELQPVNHIARLNRAIASLQNGDLDTAQQDYEFLHNIYRESHQISYGLAQIAAQKKDTPAALKYYSEYLLQAPQGTAEYQAVLDRVKELKSAKP